MILKKISLHNFMSYGDATLDMSSLSVVCLCGHNGAGKSAILDAITWALWESARASSDELIRIGQSEMWVDLTFELEGTLYRVRRSRSVSAPRTASRTTKGTLDFQICKSNTSATVDSAPASVGARADLPVRPPKTSKSSTKAEWTALTGSSMRDTQARICDVLRMDYDTFINSVYLRQGRADEFTTRSPSERKQVLSEILGLSYFDKLSDLAREQTRARKVEIDYLQAGMEDVSQLQEELSLAKAEETRLIQQLNLSRERLETAKVELAKIDVELLELSDLRSRLEPTEHRLAEIAADIEHLTPTFERLKTRRAELDEIMSAVPGMEDTLNQFNSVKSKVEELDGIALKRQSLETRRLELRSQLASQRGRLEVELEHLQSQLETLREQRQKLTKDAADREKLQNDFGAYKRLVAQEAEMSKRQEAYTQLASRAEQLHTIVVEARLRMEAELHQYREALTELTSLLASKNELDAESEKLAQRSEELDQLEVEFESVEETGMKLKQEIDVLDQNIQTLEREIVQNNQKSHELNEAHNLTMCPLCAAPIVDRAAVVQRYEDFNSNIKSQIAQHETRKAELESRRQQLRQRYLELKRELDTRKKLDMLIGEFNARRAAVARAEQNCDRTRELVSELERKLEAQDYAQVERESLVNIKAEMHKLDFDPVIFSNLQAQLRMQRNVEMRYQQYKRDQSELARLNEQIPLLEQTISDIRRQLDSNSFSAAESAELSELDTQLSAFPYDRAEHDEARTTLAKLLPLVDKLRDFERLVTEKPEVDQQFSETAAQLDSKLAQRATLEQSINAWSSRLSRHPELESTRSSLTETLLSSEESRHLAERQLAVLETKIDQLQTQQQTFDQKQSRLNALLVEMNDYAFLAESFGKKGIQAIIIENAVPELEHEANTLLSRLSDNQMHIGLVTQQKTKQGNLQETLDILIADSLGTRPYELYSGGESFKINFALRVALSRLLARRAGAKLQTLIIDEGFGSQDSSSRHRLMQAINSIKPDFSRIIIVTHITEIKELFPIQIHVEKTSGVSEITLVRN